MGLLMTIAMIRDITIIILGILYIIITIGLLAGLLIVYLKVRKTIRSINQLINEVRKVLACAKGVAMGLNEGLKLFRKGG